MNDAESLNVPKTFKLCSVLKCLLDGSVQWALTNTIICSRVLIFHLITLSDK